MSEPAVAYTSAIHTIRLRRVTTSKQTILEAISDYSSDSSLEVIQDSRFKKLEMIKALRAKLSGQPAPASLQDFVRRAADAESQLRKLIHRMDVLEGKAEESKEENGVMLQITGTAKPGKMDEMVKKGQDYISKVFTKWPAIRMHSGIVPVDENRWITNMYFTSSEGLLAYCNADERQHYNELIGSEEVIDRSTLKMTIYGEVSSAVKTLLQYLKPIYLPIHGFAH
jgi:hypothetical protein